MASDCSSSSRFSKPDVDYDDVPAQGDVLLDRIINYDKTIVSALGRTLHDRDFNLTAHLMTEVYPQWCRNLQEIHEYRLDEDGDKFWNRNPDKLFDFAVNSMVSMHQALRRGKLNTQAEKRAWMPILLRNMDQLSKAPWVKYRGKDHLLRHLDGISYFRMKNFPLNQAAWTKGEMAGNPEFEKIFADFERLVANGQPKNEQEGRGLVHSSVNLVLNAARALLISLDDINIPVEKLVNEATRPTCVDKPITDPVFFSGTKEQPGAIAMKAYLGSPPKNDSDSQFPLDGSVDYSGEKRDFGDFASPDEETITTNNIEIENLPKRQALVGKKAETTKASSRCPVMQNKSIKAASQPSKPRWASKASWVKSSTSSSTSRENDSHYQYTTADANADIGDLEAVVQGYATGSKPHVHPVVAMSADLLGKYRPTILPHVLKWNWAREAASPEHSDPVGPDLPRLEEEIAALRQVIVATRLAARPNYSNLKMLKCTVLLVRYLRSLYMRLFMAARPKDDLMQARADRLADWILHEEVWNDATKYSLKMTKSTSKLCPQLHRDLEAREANIKDWQDQLLKLQIDIAKKQAAKAEEEEEVVDAMDEEEVVVAEEEEEEAAAPVEEEVTAPLGPPPPINLPEPKYKDKDVKDLEYGAYLDEPELVLDPTRYAARMRGNTARGSRGTSGTGGEKKKKQQKVKPPKFVVFAGVGPQGYKELPKEGVYDKLQFMIIMTFWRVLQAKLNGL
ncbi:hypothetical protein PG996_007950 [Apiospora saccharicola]|uniref:Uncharacterized protein n=1 Tax=Apiospora saccharicola TaxID=335842 RepID=A0ABR1UWK0_9PEZI